MTTDIPAVLIEQVEAEGYAEFTAAASAAAKAALGTRQLRIGGGVAGGNVNSTGHGTLVPGTHDIDVDGVRQRYHVAGTGPVCLAHSGGPGIGWEYLRMPGLERHLTMVYVEPVGTGESGRLADPSAYNVGAYARFVDALVGHLGVPRVAVLGHSHGGFVGQRYALDHPDRVSHLVLYSTSPMTGPAFTAEFRGNAENFAERHRGRPEAVEIVKAVTSGAHVGDPDDPSAHLRFVTPLYFADYWGREAEFAPLRAMVTKWPGVPYTEAFDLTEELRELPVPALIITGDHDFICGPRWARMLHELLPVSQLNILPASGHFAHFEQDQEFIALVTKFLKTGDGRPGEAG